MHSVMSEGDWEHLGRLIDEQWRLNQVLTPRATNAHINALLNELRPHLFGAKLTGAGGGGFMILLAKSPEDALTLRQALSSGDRAGRLHEFSIAKDGLKV
jgi:fucokinase